MRLCVRPIIPSAGGKSAKSVLSSDQVVEVLNEHLRYIISDVNSNERCFYLHAVEVDALIRRKYTIVMPTIYQGFYSTKKCNGDNK